ncbi:transposase [Streptomyces sp. NPDC004752]
MKVSHSPAALFAAFDDPDLIAHTGLVPKRDEVVFVDIDSKVKQVYGPAKQGASFGYTKQRGLHFQIVTVKTGTCAPVIVATRLRKGSANSGKGAASLLREALVTVRAMGITAQIVVRADSAFFSHKVVAEPARRPGVLAPPGRKRHAGAEESDLAAGARHVSEVDHEVDGDPGRRGAFGGERRQDAW